MKYTRFLKLITPVFLFLFFSCETNEEYTEKTIIVASAKADCVGLIQQKCLLMKENHSENWSFFYDTVIGFAFEEGFEYVLLVSETTIRNPPQDASATQTTLIRIISKVKKNSENLPNK